MSEAPRRRLRVGCEFVHELNWATPMVLQVEPRPDAGLTVSDVEMTIDPAVPMHGYLDLYGNVCRRFSLGPGRTRIRYSALVEADGGVDAADPAAPQTAVDDLPDDLLHFTLASRYCESDLLSNTAWALFSDAPAGWPRVQAVIDWVHHNVRFAHGSTDSLTPASEVYLQRRGVCRDFTHLAITFLRALNVPARYCFGYLPEIDVAPLDEPMDFAAWLEAYVGGRWYTLDPRNNQRRSARVLVGRGRDALDTAMLTTYGSAPLLGMRVAAEPAATSPWSSAHPPVVGEFAGSTG